MSPTGMPRRPFLQAAAVAALVGAGAACARIPTSSPISVTPLGDQGQAGAPYVQARPPSTGASPEEVVSGFIQAGVGPVDDYSVAREYLTEKERARWNPTGAVTVYSGSQELDVAVLSERAVAATMQVTATLDAVGVRSRPSAPMSRTFGFELENVQGQWRISSAPDGIYLSEAAFETLFTPVRLYFADPRTIHLVPDHRWLAVHEGSSAILSALAAGPQSFLVDAVHSAVPRTSGVSDPKVSPAADGTVQVTIPAAIGALAAGPRALALAQIEASLRSAPSLPDVQLVWDGPDLTPAQKMTAERAVPGHRPFGAGPTGVVSLADPKAKAPAQLVPDLAKRAVRCPVISRDGVLAAALSEDSAAVLLASTTHEFPVREAATGGTFVPPTVDDAGFAWTSTVTGSGALLVLSHAGGGKDIALEAAWLNGREIRTLALAPDATRMLVLSVEAGVPRLDLCAVVRADDGVPRAITDPTPVRTTLADLTSVSWYDEGSAIVLGGDSPTGDRRARIVDLSGTMQPLPTLRAGTDWIAGTSVGESIWATTESGHLLRTAGGDWHRVDLPVHEPAFY